MDFSLYRTLDTDQCHIILCRHAERYEITNFHSSSEVLLTPRGKSEARKRGRRLAGRFTVKTVFHSPVARCVQTAEELVRGVRDKKDDIINGGALSWLGGDFIRADVDYVNEYMETHGWQVFLRLWFDGKLPEDKIQPLTKAAPLELEYLKKQLVTGAGLVIDVTHDWNMMVLLEYYLGVRFETAGMPDFLEAITISAAPAGRVRLAYRGNSVAAG